MIQVNFLKSNFLITDFKAKGALSNRSLVVTNSGTYFYDVYSRSVENYSFVADTAPITQVHNFKISFHSLKTVSPSNSSLGFLLTFPSGGFIVFDRDFLDETKLKVFVSPGQEYFPNPLSSPFDSYTCLNPYPHLNQILQTTHSMSISILNKDAQSKLVTLKINEVIIFEGDIDFKTLGLKDFNIGIHNFNNDLRITSMSVEGDDSKDIIVNKTSYQYWRVSNIKNRDKDQSFRSIGNLIFKAKTGEISDNPAYGFSESHYSQETLPGNAFDGLNTTYTLSSSLEDGTNTEQHGSSWWIGYKFPTDIELESLSLSVRYDISEESSGQEWSSFYIEGSLDGILWEYVSSCLNSKIFKNDITTHTYKKSLNESIEARWWRVSNIETTSSPIRSAASLQFNNNLNILCNITGNCFSESSNDTEYSVEKAFDQNPNTYTRSREYTSYGEGLSSYYIGYKFDVPVEVLTVSVQMQHNLVSDSNTVGREWKKAIIEYSLDGVIWNYFGNITPDISLNDISLKENISIITPLKSEFKYVPISPNIENLKYKFWRASNLNIDIKTLTSSLTTSASNISFNTSEGIIFNNLQNSFCFFGLNPENAFDLDANTKSESNSHFLKVQDYSIGCMFDTPVEVDSFKYNYNSLVDSSKWLSANIEYSSNGFDWYVKGYCDFRDDVSSKTYPIKSKEDLQNKAKFWRMSNFVSQIPSGIDFNSYSFVSGLRFNTLGGEPSRYPKKTDPNFGLYFSDDILGPSNSFASALNIPTNYRYSTTLTRSGQNDYYSFVLQENSSVKIYSEGSIDMYGHLYNSSQNQINANDDSGGSGQFLMQSDLPAGRYYVMARHYNSSTTGNYSLIIQTNSNSIDSDVNKFISYEFKNPELVDSVRFVSSRPPLYCKLESSLDNEVWEFQGYLNFLDGTKILNIDHFNVKRSLKNFFDLFKAESLKPLDHIIFKEQINKFNSKFLNPNIKNINIYNNDNDGTISGEVTELDIPVIREVGLYDRRTRQLVAITWSDEKGQYKFPGIDSTRKYYVHAIDSNDFYNAVTQDMIEPLI